MANILFRGTTAPTQPVLVSGGSAAKNSPLTLEEGDWNYKALNDDIQTRATSANPSLTGIVNIQYNIRSALAKYNKYVAGLNGTIPAAGCKIGEYIPTGNSQNATLILEIVLRSNGQYARAKSTIAIRSETLPVVTATIQTELENNDVLGLAIETWVDTSNGKVVFFAVPTGVVTGNISFDVVSYERDAYNAFTIATSIIEKDAVGLTQVVATAKKINTGDITAVSFSGNGSGLTSLNATNLSSGTISGARGVAAGSNSVSFIKYNGITKAAGNFDSGSTNPSNTNRLNFDGYFYATRFYGDGSNLTNVNATKLSTGRLINNSVFDGTSDITTTKWGTARSITIGNTTKSVDGSGNMSWNLSEIGAPVVSDINISPVVVTNNTSVTLGTTNSAIYSCDTSSASFTLTLPSNPPGGSKVSIIDHASTFGTKKLVVGRNGKKIMGLNENMDITTNNANISLIFINSTNDWRIL